MRARFLAPVFIVVLALGTLAGGLVSASAQPNQPDLSRAIAAQEKHNPQLLRLSGVVGTAVGLTDRGEPSVLVLLERGGIPSIPNTLDGVAVVTRVTGRIVALHHQCDHTGGRPGSPPAPACTPTPGGGGDATATPTLTPPPTNTPAGGPEPATTARWPRPVPIGISTGHFNITAGTIGARVRDQSNRVYALSNNHVYANSNLAGIGDNVLQPGPYDGGQNAGDAIGTLADFEPILFGGADNIVDAAIALSTTDNIGNATPSNGYGTPRSATASSFVNQRIQKHGRTTGLTSGKVWGVNTTVNVDYGGGQVAKFVRQILVIGGGFSRGGDSGSLVVVQGGQDDRKPVGLLFAGSSNSTIINPIDDVLAAFSVTIDGN